MTERETLERLIKSAEEANTAFRLYNRGGDWQTTDRTFTRLETQIKNAREVLASQLIQGCTDDSIPNHDYNCEACRVRGQSSS